MSDYRDRLKKTLILKKGKNNGYSLRAFARDIGICPSSLSLALAKRRHLSERNLEKVGRALGWSELDIGTAEKLILRSRQSGLKMKRSKSRPHQLSPTVFSEIYHWHCFAVLSLAKIKNNRAEAGWIAKRLGIRRSKAELALRNLEKHGLIQIVDGKLERAAEEVEFSDMRPTSALIASQLQYLELAKKAVQSIPYSRRQALNSMIAIRPGDLESQARKILKLKSSVQAELCTESPTDIYVLMVHLFPLSQ
jgi:uncharacterized protein (TIGR02147 family)